MSRTRWEKTPINVRSQGGRDSSETQGKARSLNGSGERNGWVTNAWWNVGSSRDKKSFHGGTVSSKEHCRGERKLVARGGNSISVDLIHANRNLGHKEDRNYVFGGLRKAPVIPRKKKKRKEERSRGVERPNFRRYSGTRPVGGLRTEGRV